MMKKIILLSLLTLGGYITLSASSYNITPKAKVTASSQRDDNSAAIMAVEGTGSGVFAQTTKIYVSPAGSDKNNGSFQHPFKSLEKARDAARKLNKNKVSVLIYLRKGYYLPDSTFVLTPDDSGEKNKPVVYKAYENEEVIIDGRKKITGWQSCPSSITLPLNPRFRDKIKMAYIPKGWRFHYLFVNGMMRRRSQSDHRYWRYWNKDHVPGTPDKNGQIILFSDNQQLKYLPSNGDAEMVCIMAQYGIMGNGVITDVDTVHSTLKWNSHQVNIRPSRNNAERGYCFENVPYFIDTPGDWAVDSKNGIVYYYPLPEEDMNKVTITAPHLTELLRFEGDELHGNYVHDVEMNGLIFIGTDRLPENEWPYSWLMRQWENVDATVYLSGTLRCKFINNKILNSGAYGITLHHFAQQNVIEGNEIGFTGSGGIFLEGYGPGTMDVNKNNIITRNYIHDHGLGNYWHSPCIQIYQSGSNIIQYNLLQRSAYSAISTVGMDPGRMSDSAIAKEGTFEGQVQKWNMGQIRFNDFPDSVQQGIVKGSFKFDRETIKPYIHSNKNMIQYNVISEPHSLLYEGGAIYAWCLGKHNLWQGNVIFKSAGMPGSSVLALDDLAEYTTVEDNIFWVEGTILNGIGSRKEERGDIIRNNYRVNYQPAFEATAGKDKIGSWWLNDTGRTKMDEALNKIESIVQQKGGWPGNPAIGVPAKGEPIHKYGTSEMLPQGSHVTIEQ